MAKEAKEEVDYSRGHLHSHCGPTFRTDTHYCMLFIPGKGEYGTCHLVEGSIDPVMWCKRYKQVEK